MNLSRSSFRRLYLPCSGPFGATAKRGGGGYAARRFAATRVLLSLVVLSLLQTGCAAAGRGAAAPPPPPAGAEAALARRLSETLHRRDDGSVHYGARVVDIASGRELYASDADRPVLPASNMKLPTSAADLDRFGAGHAFKTYLAIDGDDLWLIGTGDPATGDPTIAKKAGGTPLTILDAWADALKRRGVERVRGDLYYYGGALDDQLTHPSWSKSFRGDWYAAPVAGLNFNDNCIDVTLTPAAAKGAPAAFAVMPPTAGVKILNKVTTGAGPEAAIVREPEAPVFTLSGAVTKRTALESKAVTDPAHFFADALRTHLASRGIRIEGEIRRADKPLGGSLVPPADAIVATHETAMPDALWRINKNSQNVFAEAFCKMLGRQHRADAGRDEPGSWEAGGEAVRGFLRRSGIDDAGLVVADGSGLSRDNRVTARLMSDLLVRMFAHRDGGVFRDSLSVAGRDGTLGKRLTDVAGHVFAKTGFIGGVRACSGYVRTRGGRWLAFSFIYNGIDGSVKPYEALQDEAIRLLVAWPDLRSVPATAPATRPAVAQQR